MNLDEVRALPRASMYALMVKDLLKDMGSHAATVLHAALGISGEAGETIPAVIRDDFPNMVEELGDGLFYAQGLLNMFGWTLEEMLETIASGDDQDLIDDFLQSPGAGMVYYASNIIDEVKKTWAYNKEMNVPALKYSLGMYYRMLEETLSEWDLTFDDIEAHNQNKLVSGPNARYPSGKYSDAAAQARADKAESPNLPGLPAWPSSPAVEGNPPFIVTGNGA